MLENHVEELAEHGIDYNDAIERFGGNSEMYEKFVFRYLQDTRFEELKVALEQEDVEEGYVTAHTLKGVVGNLSFTDFFNDASQMCEALREGDLEQAKELIPAMDDDHAKVVAILQKYS